MNRKAIVYSAVTLTLLSMYGCSAPDPLPFDPAKMQRNSRQAAEQLPNHDMKAIERTLDRTYAPRQAGQPASTRPTTMPTLGHPLSEDPILRLTLQEVIHRTVNSNMEIRVAGYDPAINSHRVIEAESKFDPTFFAVASTISAAGPRGAATWQAWQATTAMWRSRYGRKPWERAVTALSLIFSVSQAL